jgi:hypothetical protein
MKPNAQHHQAGPAEQKFVRMYLRGCLPPATQRPAEEWRGEQQRTQTEAQG